MAERGEGGGLLRVDLRHVLDVGAADEGPLAGTGEDHAADVAVGGHVGEHVAQAP